MKGAKHVTLDSTMLGTGEALGPKSQPLTVSKKLELLPSQQFLHYLGDRISDMQQGQTGFCLIASIGVVN